MSGADRPRGRPLRRNARRAVRWVLPPLLLVAVCVSWVAFQALNARTELNRAAAELTAGQRLAAAGDLSAAARQVAAAAGDAASARDRLDGWLFRLWEPVPWVGTQVGAAQDLARVAADLSDGGSRLVDAAAASAVARQDPSTSVGVRSLRTLAQDLRPVAGPLADTRRALSAAGAVVERLRGESLVGPLRDAVDALEPQLTTVDRQLGAVEGAVMLTDRGAQAGPPLRLLFLAQDTWELRPSGGYIGSYGILEIGNGRIHMARYRDAVDLPYPRTRVRPPEPLDSNLPHPWSLTGAGWWPDFPTSARAAQKLLELQTGERVDGVLGSTQQFLEDLLTATGGTLTVPGYPDVLTPSNISDRILYNVELKRPLDTPRKKFLTLLTEELFDRLEALKGSSGREVMSAFGRAFKVRHLQLYLNDPDDQAVVERADWSGALTAPEHGDLFTLADANFGTDKANRWVRKQTTYTVTRTEAGRLVAQVEVRTTDFGERSTINPAYSSYLRVYAPPGSVLVDPDEHVADVRTGTENGLVTFGAGQTIRPESSQTRRFVYYLPESVVRDGVYRLMVRPQAGTPDDTITVRLRLGGAPITRTFTSDEGDQTLTARVGDDVDASPDAPAADGPWVVQPPAPTTDECEAVVPQPAPVRPQPTAAERRRALIAQQRLLQPLIARLQARGCEQVGIRYAPRTRR